MKREIIDDTVQKGARRAKTVCPALKFLWAQPSGVLIFMFKFRLRISLYRKFGRIALITTNQVSLYLEFCTLSCFFLWYNDGKAIIKQPVI